MVKSPQRLSIFRERCRRLEWCTLPKWEDLEGTSTGLSGSKKKGEKIVKMDPGGSGNIDSSHK